MTVTLVNVLPACANLGFMSKDIEAFGQMFGKISNSNDHKICPECAW